MKVFISQINPVVGDLDYNLRKIIDVIHAARDCNANLVVFPEMAMCGYSPEDLLLLPDFIEAIEDKLNDIIDASQNIAVIIGTIRRNEGVLGKNLYNTAAIIFNKKLLGYQDKSLLPTYDVFDEERYFEPSSKCCAWEIDGINIAVTVCEDAWQDLSQYHFKPLYEIKKLKPNLMINLSASPFSIGKINMRNKVFSEAAKYLQADVIVCNQVGVNDELVFDGHSQYIDAEGNLLAIAKGFAEDGLIIDTELSYGCLQYKEDADELLFKSLVLGLKDYFKKLGFKTACLGLSGGIDSAVVACIAAEALGTENIIAVNMPSRYSSEGSVEDSQKLSDNLNISMISIPIEDQYEVMVESLIPYFKGKGFDATEENLQARIRGIILMSLSNKHGYIVLGTSNKSEAAVGYSTLYGDMCGGINILGDVLKTQVYALAHYINRKYEVIPKEIINKPPSAELRYNQKDSDHLPEYEVIDAVIKDYIEEGCSSKEIALKNGFEISIVKELIYKIHANEYKRRQAPPSIRVSKKSFSKGRICPIVQRWT